MMYYNCHSADSRKKKSWTAQQRYLKWRRVSCPPPAGKRPWSSSRSYLQVKTHTHSPYQFIWLVDHFNLPRLTYLYFGSCQSFLWLSFCNFHWIHSLFLTWSAMSSANQIVTTDNSIHSNLILHFYLSVLISFLSIIVTCFLLRWKVRVYHTE